MLLFVTHCHTSFSLWQSLVTGWQCNGGISREMRSCSDVTRGDVMTGKRVWWLLPLLPLLAVGVWWLGYAGGCQRSVALAS